MLLVHGACQAVVLWPSRSLLGLGLYIKPLFSFHDVQAPF